MTFAVGKIALRVRITGALTAVWTTGGCSTVATVARAFSPPFLGHAILV